MSQQLPLKIKNELEYQKVRVYFEIHSFDNPKEGDGSATSFGTKEVERRDTPYLCFASMDLLYWYCYIASLSIRGFLYEIRFFTSKDIKTKYYFVIF